MREVTTAEELIWAILMFEQEQLPIARWADPTLGGSIGEFGILFMPSGKAVPLAEVHGTLAGLQPPVLVGSLAAKGVVGVWSGNDASAADFARRFDGQREALLYEATEHQLTDASRIVLSYGLTVVTFSFATLRECFSRYASTMGWSLEDDVEADARLRLVTAAGARSDLGD